MHSLRSHLLVRITCFTYCMTPKSISTTITWAAATEMAAATEIMAVAQIAETRAAMAAATTTASTSLDVLQSLPR